MQDNEPLSTVDLIAAELAYCRHIEMTLHEQARRVLSIVFNNPPKHHFWGAGESDCPRDIKTGNGELHTLQCKVCGKKNPRAGSICHAG